MKVRTALVLPSGILWDNLRLQMKESIGWCIYIARFSQIMPVTAAVALLACVFLRSDDKYRIVSISAKSPKVEQGQYCPCHSSWHFEWKKQIKIERALMVFTLTKCSHKNAWDSDSCFTCICLTSSMHHKYSWYNLCRVTLRRQGQK
jgi:hypothetical protein